MVLIDNFKRSCDNFRDNDEKAIQMFVDSKYEQEINFYSLWLRAMTVLPFAVPFFGQNAKFYQITYLNSETNWNAGMLHIPSSEILSCRNESCIIYSISFWFKTFRYADSAEIQGTRPAP